MSVSSSAGPDGLPSSFPKKCLPVLIKPAVLEVRTLIIVENHTALVVSHVLMQKCKNQLCVAFYLRYCLIFSLFSDGRRKMSSQQYYISTRSFHMHIPILCKISTFIKVGSYYIDPTAQLSNPIYPLRDRVSCLNRFSNTRNYLIL